MQPNLRQDTGRHTGLTPGIDPQLAPHASRVVVAAGMQGTGVSTIATHMRAAVLSIDVIDAGAQWIDVLEACTAGAARLVIVTTHDIVAVSSAYALVKMVRDRFPVMAIEVLVNLSEAREALKTYERIQVAASHFLEETVGYAGAIPDDRLYAAGDVARTGASSETLVGPGAVLAIHDLATRLEEELRSTDGLAGSRQAERRMMR